MIRVSIVNDERIISSVSSIRGNGILMAWAQENEKSPGFCIFSATGEIMDVTDRDNVFELLTRATLNYLDLNGVNMAYSKNTALFGELKKLGFKENGNNVEVVINDFFKPCCNK